MTVLASSKLFDSGYRGARNLLSPRGCVRCRGPVRRRKVAPCTLSLHPNTLNHQPATQNPKRWRREKEAGDRKREEGALAEMEEQLAASEAALDTFRTVSEEEVAALRAEAADAGSSEREFFIANLLVRIRFIVVMIRWTGIAPCEFEFPFPGSSTSTFLERFLNLRPASTTIRDSAC